VSPLAPHSFPTRRSSDLRSSPVPEPIVVFLAGPLKGGPAGGIRTCPFSGIRRRIGRRLGEGGGRKVMVRLGVAALASFWLAASRSEEHTSELQSRENLVC